LVAESAYFQTAEGAYLEAKDLAGGSHRLQEGTHLINTILVPVSDGHGFVREAIFGGVSQALIERAAIPVFDALMHSAVLRRNGLEALGKIRQRGLGQMLGQLE
jgi:hypothetical protein